jgi:signal transduction histidine kinase
MVVIFLSESWENMQQSQDLKEAMRRAEASAAAKSDFLAFMSHEIRTPLNGIVGSAELLQNAEELDTQQQQSIAHIQNCSTALLGIINDILDFAKIDSQKMDIEKVPFSVVRVAPKKPDQV